MNGATPKSATALNIALWVAQLLLAIPYAMLGWMKATGDLAQLSQMMKWIPDFPVWFVRGLGVLEILGAIGLILPSLTRIQPRWTVIAAVCILLHQACAVTLHLTRGEFTIVLNAVLIALAAFIYWGRSRKVPIAAR
jgi:uncharacterized membrane protein YphA (DoxX/SURF4 family)